MQLVTASIHDYKRLKTKEVTIGHLKMGYGHPIRMQTMTTLDTMDTQGIVEQTIRCVDKGAELVRITAPSIKEAENLGLIKKELVARGYHVPLVADIHFTPNAALIAARHIEKVRINPGNYVDKKKFETIEYTDAAYAEEIQKIRDKFIPLIKVCKEHGTALRIGTNHGSLSDRIMSRYGDTHFGMVESAMEFLRIARDENFHNIVLSMKSSNPIVMVDAYRMLVKTMSEEFNELYPLHLGVTEAGDGEDGRVKSAVGIGTLLEDGIGDTIRVSLTEEPEEEIAVCRDLISRYPMSSQVDNDSNNSELEELLFQDNTITPVINSNIGGLHHPVVIADLTHASNIDYDMMVELGYIYNADDDKWTIKDLAPDYLYCNEVPQFDNFPGTLKCILPFEKWSADLGTSYLPMFNSAEDVRSHAPHFPHIVHVTNNLSADDCTMLNQHSSVILLTIDGQTQRLADARSLYIALRGAGLMMPVMLHVISHRDTFDQCLIDYSTEAGSLMIDTHIQGLMLSTQSTNRATLISQIENEKLLQGRNYHSNTSVEAFLNTTTFSILQAVRKRITKTEYISCPSCGRTLFDLQETTAMIRQRTDHLKGVKIAIMGCIVNGPGEMADADFGYVGSGVGKITLYKGQEVVKRNVPSETAVDELINLLKENDVWIDPITV